MSPSQMDADILEEFGWTKDNCKVTMESQPSKFCMVSMYIPAWLMACPLNVYVDPEQIESENPNDLKIMIYALDNGMYIANYSEQKGDVFVEIDAPKKNQTYIDLNFQILDQNQYFKIKGDDKLLVIKAKGVLMNELKIK